MSRSYDGERETRMIHHVFILPPPHEKFGWSIYNSSSNLLVRVAEPTVSEQHYIMDNRSVITIWLHIDVKHE